jgi:MarR family transcriptional regulator, organic hydroperoxide resistance regulator
MTSEPLRLGSQVCYPLYASARRIMKRYKPFLEPLGLTYTQYLVMMVLWEDKACSVSGLGARLDLDSGTLTPLLKRLEAQGYVKRNRSAWDERIVVVEATPKGVALETEALAIPAKMRACLDLPDEDLKELRRLLDGILRSPDPAEEDADEGKKP